jgi:phage terminase large subunit-like protein
MDRATKKWIRNASDEKAAQSGCRFDESRGRFVVEWIERYCRLYEGEWAGQQMKLSDWQLDCTLRLFGWVRHSKKWNRLVRRFRAASIWVAKKNKKSPTLAAWGLYLLCGDGEPGQKIFLGAKDGRQARDIAGKHAVEMMLASRDLTQECRLNRNLMQITHLPSKSILLPLSSSNERHQQSKEGLNGSVLVDECHVVDRDFMRRMSRAGISRSEPLQIEVSTAGNDPQSYGRERFDYACQVERGDRDDSELFAAIYAAPQDLADVELGADPLKFGRLANPAMGHTVDPDEYVADYQKSRRTDQALADFKMYRLNIWQRASNPWLKAADWDACRDTFVEADLAGQTCWAGLDLSRTRDMSALVLVFATDQPESFRVLPYFWLPAERAQELDHLFPVRTWAAGGHLELTPGNVLDYGFVRARFRELALKFRIRELAYDPRFAEETTQTLEQGVSDNQGKIIEEGTGVPRFAFAQTDANFAGPTEDFERAVIAGRLKHNGHPVLTWQAGHGEVTIRPISKSKRVIKAKKSDPRSIDGIIAGIMALARAKLKTASVYESRGLEFIELGGPAQQNAGPSAEADDDDDRW